MLFILLVALPCRAHNPDTSYTRLKISPDKIEIEFIFDLQVLTRLVEPDENHDGQVTREELLHQAPKVQDYIRHQIAVQIDGEPADFGTADPVTWSAETSAVAPKDFHQTLVFFPFRKRVTVPPQSVALVFDVFNDLGERHTNLASIQQGSHHIDEIVFTVNERDYTYYVEAEPSRTAHLWKFLKLGVEHIFLGYDHILFLLALIVVSRFKELVKIVTAFTVAHTITLILAALEIVTLPTRLIETGIAATIMYVALENLWAKRTGHRWVLTFFFGLIHGFGFANVLRDLGLPTEGLVRSLLCFNLGVELGQLAIVAALLPLTIWLGKRQWRYRPQTVLSVLIFLFGFAWFIERAFALKFMPI